jgi:thioesterase domain-containing protein/acyl carrier protein
VVHRTVQKLVGTREIVSDRPLRKQGFDSLDMLRLAIDLEKELGRPVPLLRILMESSVESIARSIADDIHRESDPVVTLHPGASHCRTGIFCIPGVGGSVFSFERLVDGLPSWCPLYGLPYPGISGERKPKSRVEDLADTLVDASISKLPKNPILVGYSFGGFVAFEFARRLVEREYRPVVVVIDAAPVSLALYRGGSGTIRNWKLKLANVLPESLANRVGLEKSFAVKHLRSVVAASFEAIRHYNPAPLDVPVTLLRTIETDFSPFEEVEDLGWRKLTPQVTIDYLPGRHLDVFRGASMELAQKIRVIASDGRNDP